MSLTYMCKITSMSFLNAEHFLVRIVYPDSTFSFKPGMFVMLNLPGEKPARAFSIASSPKQKDRMEFYVKVNQNGTFTQNLAKSKVGDHIELSGPHGKFLLQDENEPIYFLSAGTGVAPLMSMLRYLLEEKQNQEIFFFHGASYESELCFRSELQTLDQKKESFHYLPSLSRENPGWAGLRGRVNNVFVDKLPTINASAYVCGPPAMVRDTVNKLILFGVPKMRIKTEKYG